MFVVAGRSARRTTWGPFKNSCSIRQTPRESERVGVVREWERAFVEHVHAQRCQIVVVVVALPLLLLLPRMLFIKATCKPRSKSVTCLHLNVADNARRATRLLLLPLAAEWSASASVRQIESVASENWPLIGWPKKYNSGTRLRITHEKCAGICFSLRRCPNNNNNQNNNNNKPCYPQTTDNIHFRAQDRQAFVFTSLEAFTQNLTQN